MNLSEPKKISLRTVSDTGDQHPAQRRDLNRLESEEGLSLDISDTLDMFDEPEPRKRGREQSFSPVRKAQVISVTQNQIYPKNNKTLNPDRLQGYIFSPIRRTW